MSKTGETRKKRPRGKVRAGERDPGAPAKDGDGKGDLELQVIGGLKFSNLLGSVGQELAYENRALLQALVELLIAKGVVHLAEVEERRARLGPCLAREQEDLPRLQLIDAPDKYKAVDETVRIDCESRIGRCRAACCKLWFPLTVQDLDEGIVRWNFAQPYGIRQGADGYCAHLGRSTHRCAIYAKRPLICRSYDCRGDRRIWLDFEKGEINPELDDLLKKRREPMAVSGDDDGPPADSGSKVTAGDARARAESPLRAASEGSGGKRAGATAADEEKTGKRGRRSAHRRRE